VKNLKTGEKVSSEKVASLLLGRLYGAYVIDNWRHKVFINGVKAGPRHSPKTLYNFSAPASYLMGTRGQFPEVKRGRGVALTINTHLVQR
jgi:hypothetical protein